MSERDGFGVVYREGLCREQAQVLAHEKFLPGKTTKMRRRCRMVVFRLFMVTVSSFSGGQSRWLVSWN